MSSALFLGALLSSILSSPRQAKADPPGAGWTLTFSDEFNDQSAFDTTKWSAGTGSLTSNGEKEWYVNAAKNIDVSSGSSVKLTALKDNPTTSYVYSSGELHSKFTQAFGYFECRAKVPDGGKGLWPAFWMLEGSTESPYNWPPEIDIMEWVSTLNNSTPYTVYMTNHYSGSYPLDGGSNLSWQKTYICSEVLSTNFHVFGLLWEPDRLIWYVDGVERYNITAYVPYTRAMYLILNLAVGGSWPGNPNDATVFPAVFEIDYVRAWQKPLPAPWAATDIGSPSKPGRTAASSSGLFNVYSTGTCIGGTSDQFQFAYLPLVGSGTMVARVANEVDRDTIYNGHSKNTLAGLMIRDSLSADAANAFMALKPVISGTSYGNTFSSRATTSGSTITTGSSSNPVPGWLKLVRSGSTFTGYCSTDGTSWAVTGTASISMGDSAFAGFAVTSSGTQKATAQFDNISITGTATPVLTSILLSPQSEMVEPYTASQFSAVAYDQYRNLINPQPTFTWNTTGGGTVDSNGIFTSGSDAGGTYTIQASSGTVSGSASVTVANTPNGPIELTATAATMLNGWIRLNWTNNSNIATGYKIQSQNTSTYVWTNEASVSSTTTTYTKTAHMPSGPFIYRVFATGSGGHDSDYSNTVSISVPTPPVMPNTLVATTGTNPYKVTLTWEAVSGANDYSLLRSKTSGTSGFSTVNNHISALTYSDSNVVSGSTYWYTVCYNVTGQGSSQSCNPVSVTVGNAALVLTTISVSPSSASVQGGATQQFTAVGKDQNVADLSLQPSFTWTTTGGGTIDSNGLFTAGASAGGPYTITATSGAVSGTASMTVFRVDDIIVDNAASSGVTVTGTWTASTSNSGYYGSNYQHDGNTGKGTKDVKFTPTVVTPGLYNVYARWPAAANRATNVTVNVYANGTNNAVIVNQQTNGGQWNLLGNYRFVSGTSGYVQVTNTASDGYVIADAVKLEYTAP